MKTKNDKLTDNGQQAEPIMQASLQLLPLIMNNIPQAVFWKDRDLVYLGCNQAFADDAGFSSPEEVVGKTDFDMPWKAQAELYCADDRLVMKKGEPKLNYEESQTSPDGSTIWLSTSKIPVTENGQIVAVLGMYEDITARKQAEMDFLLRDRALASSLNAVIIVNISDNKPIYVNDAILKMTGYTREEVMQIGLADITGNTDEPKKIRAAIQSQGFFIGEELLKRKDGSIFPANFFSSLIIGNEGRPVAVQTTFFDISERKQAEKTIQESEERFRRFTEVTSEGLVFHEQGRIIDANPSALAMFGLSESAEFVGKNLLGFIIPESHEMVLSQMKLENVEPYEIQCIHTDGSIFPVETSTRTYKVEDRTIRATSIRDITARKQVETVIQETRARFQGLVETLSDWVWEVDPNGAYTYVSPKIKDLLGYAPEEILGKTPFDIMPPEEAQRVAGVFGPLLSTQQPLVALENTNRHKDGHLVVFETSGLPFFDINGNFKGYRGTDRDITARKQAEAALKENQQLLRLVMDNIPQSVFWKDKEQLTYLGVNQAFAEDAGFTSSQELVAKNDFDMPWKEQAELYRADDRRVLELGEAKLNYEEPQTGPSGQITWLRTSKIPMRDANGNIFAVLGMYEDITERKQLEAQIQEAFERRGYQVLVSTEISQEVAAASEVGDLFDRVVTLTKERLGYYHTQLLRYDPAQDAVVLINGYGETGKEMLAGGHKMPLGAGLIGAAAESGQTIMRPTLAEDPDWRPNPLLPETKGEISVPIKFGEKILGVLDVQSDKAGALTEDDRLLLEGICGQIAIAMQSAELVKTIRENEARLAEALRAARLGNWEYDFENDLFIFTDDFYSIFRTTAERVGGYKISSADYSKNFVHPDDAPLVGSEIQKVLDAKDRLFTTHLEHRIIFSDGEVGYIAVNINVERDESGKITRWYGANQDITERKQAETRLAEALKAARLANWEYDVEKDIFTFNDQFYSIFHTTAEKTGGYQLSSARYAELFVYPDDMDMVGAEIGKALSSTERVYNTTLDHRILYADGGVGYITVQLTVERDENGKIIRYYGANQDITERIKQQQEMAERLEEINRLYRAMSHEGWKNYRDTADLPAGFMFDQAGARPVDETVLTDELFANIPMRVLGGEVVGTLTVANDPQHPTSPEDYTFLQQVSDQIALALESARLFDQTQSALEQSEKLFDASSRLAQATDLQGLVGTVVETLKIPEINRAIMVTFNYTSSGDLDGMDVIANWWNGSGHEATAVGTHYSLEVIRLMPMFISPTPVFFHDAYMDERVDATTMQLVKRLNLRAVAVLPLHSGTHQMGALILEAEEPHNFTQDETRLYSALAPQVATVLENRRQFERAQKQAERESTLNTISQKIQSATTVEAVLQIAARELGHALGAPMTIAQLSMKDK